MAERSGIGMKWQDFQDFGMFKEALGMSLADFRLSDG